MAKKLLKDSREGMPIGYCSHGKWDTLRNIKKLEVNERGNDWFNDKGIDLDNTLAIWVSYKPEIALRYNFSAEVWYPQSHIVKGHYLYNELLEFKKQLKNPEQYVEKIDLSDSELAVDDEDGGFLYIKRKNL